MKAAACGALYDDGTLAKGQSIKACKPDHELINRNDGNVVLYQSSSAK